MAAKTLHKNWHCGDLCSLLGSGLLLLLPQVCHHQYRYCSNISKSPSSASMTPATAESLQPNSSAYNPPAYSWDPYILPGTDGKIPFPLLLLLISVQEDTRRLHDITQMKLKPEESTNKKLEAASSNEPFTIECTGYK